jgi:hypothetical protein
MYQFYGQMVILLVWLYVTWSWKNVTIISIASFFEFIYADESDASWFFLQDIFTPTVDVCSEACANNPSLNQVTESYFGAQKHHENQSPFLLTSDLNSQSKQLASSLVEAPPNDNVPARQNSLGMWKYFEDGITCLEGNPSSAIPTSPPVTTEIFHINEISPEWAYCRENTKVFFSFNPLLNFHALVLLSWIVLFSW